ncbi:homoserine kinase [Pararhodobacter marinus]|uniref:Homoserine kinase n=1 Tax=Pararhodobacter marinus TaxID=2184063 RepID=A0A2U2CIZ9_9RHOB|nr:phosphotransferase [Pararhodobacter marinus]PWE31842.1 homoserine kinase [Pararhodobacter marinus]
MSAPDGMLARWGLDGAATQLVAQRENKVWRVEQGGRVVALRLHRPGYRTQAELASELDWLQALHEGGLGVPRPVPGLDGAMLQPLENGYASVLNWLPGRPMGVTGTPLDLPDRAGLFRQLGRDMARMHDVSDAWARPAGFARASWDRAGLVGEAPLWGRFWENPMLDPRDRALFEGFRARADAQLAQIDATADRGLIHADLVRENILIDGAQLHFVDFDDGGFGYRLFDLATTLFKARPEPDYPVLRDALLDGYGAVRAIDTRALDLFIALRASSYLGWIVPRLSEPGASERSQRFLTAARELVAQQVA